MKRYYLHGDLSLGETYYCDICDRFKDKSHFETAHTQSNHFNRLQQSSDRFRRFYRDRYDRPDAANETNLFY